MKFLWILVERSAVVWMLAELSGDFNGFPGESGLRLAAAELFPSSIKAKLWRNAQSLCRAAKYSSQGCVLFMQVSLELREFGRVEGWDDDLCHTKL